MALLQSKHHSLPPRLLQSILLKSYTTSFKTHSSTSALTPSPPQISHLQYQRSGRPKTQPHPQPSSFLDTDLLILKETHTTIPHSSFPKGIWATHPDSTAGFAVIPVSPKICLHPIPIDPYGHYVHCSVLAGPFAQSLLAAYAPSTQAENKMWPSKLAAIIDFSSIDILIEDLNHQPTKPQAMD